MADETIQKIGLLGGTFDPVHNGHLKIATFVKQTIELDRIWFVPAALSPHKHVHHNGSGVTPFIDRLAMLEDALQEFDDFELTLIETERTEPSYTIDTFREIDKRQTVKSAFYFILGQDAFQEIDSWKEYELLLDYASLVVLSRPSDELVGIDTLVGQVFPEACYEGNGIWACQNKNKVIYLEMDPVPVSSTDIRCNVGAGKSIAPLVPVSVAEYIIAHQLYNK